MLVLHATIPRVVVAVVAVSYCYFVHVDSRTWFDLSREDQAYAVRLSHLAPRFHVFTDKNCNIVPIGGVPDAHNLNMDYEGSGCAAE